jgi:hypothetical protein
MATNTKTQTPDYGYFDEGADLQEQTLQAMGFRRVQHFNESTTYHRGSVIERGGYGIRNEDGNAPQIGKTETIKHRGNNSSVMNVSQSLDVALIGFSPRYFVIEPPHGSDLKAEISPTYQRNLPEGWKCRSAISLFVAVKADEERNLYECSFKGYNTDDAAKLINQAKAIVAKLSDEASGKRGKPTRIHTFGLWLPLGVAESRMVGTIEQSPVTPPKWNIIEGENLTPRMVSKDDYLRFIELRKELDVFLATGRYEGRQVAQIVAPQALPALASADADRY